MTSQETEGSIQVDPARDARHRLYARLATASLLTWLALGLFNVGLTGWVASKPHFVSVYNPYDHWLAYSLYLQGGCALLPFLFGLMSTRTKFIWYSLAASVVTLVVGMIEYYGIATSTGKG